MCERNQRWKRELGWSAKKEIENKKQQSSRKRSED
jgi:uncharacterized protein YjcR